MASARTTLALRVLACAVVVAGVAWLARHTDVDSLRTAFADAHVWPLVAAAVINFAIIACKAIVWRDLLARTTRVPVFRLMRYALIAYAASTFLPLRGGEVLRVWLLRDREGVPAARSAAVAVAEKLLDVVSMLLVLAPLPLLVDDLPPSIVRTLAFVAVGGLIAVAAISLLVPRLGTEGWRGELAQGLQVVREPRLFARSVAVLYVSWLIDIAMVALVLHAVGIPPSAGTCVLVLFAINLAIALPSTPGHLGAFELGGVVALRLLHVSDARALAFALLYHLVQVLPVLLSGLLVGWREIWRRS